METGTVDINRKTVDAVLAKVYCVHVGPFSGEKRMEYLPIAGAVMLLVFAVVTVMWGTEVFYD